MYFRFNTHQLYWLFIWFFVLVYLVLGDTFFAKELTHIKNFSRNQYGISYIFPLGRTELGRDTQIISEEPVYITVHTPLRYAKGLLKVRFTGSPKGWSIGLQSGPGFSYELISLEEQNEQEILFNTTNAYYENNRIRFIFSNTSKNITPLIVERVSVTLTDPYGGLTKAIKENILTTYEKITTVF